MENKERRGSALLIVLGMMSFMVISAVAFSMFMRQNRLPSSFLRQRQSSAQLVKAALAGAMQRIDAAIGDSPYPNVGHQSDRSREFKKKNGDRVQVTYGNFWQNGRVFLETQISQEAAQQTASGGEDDEEINLDYDPVSTLTLEGLAHLPPPLVNTVRYWSKRTSTAAWASLGYDAGRYAFTAVNVSDYFDINRVRANVMRDSTPENRISMGYLFENADHTGFGAVKPEDFEKFIGEVTNDTYRTRLVSLADYSLAVGSGAYGNAGFRSPFYDFIKSPAKDGSFYGSGYEDAKRQKFVTDSWFPAARDPDALYLTDDATGQPFDGLEDAPLDKLSDLNVGNEAYKIVFDHLDLCTLGALYDYVDEDSVPISLAIPTMERTPLLTGISVEPRGLEVTLGAPTQTPLQSTDKGGTQVTRTLYTWAVDSIAGKDGAFVEVSGCGVFPFKRKLEQGAPSHSYKVRVCVKLFFSDNGAFADPSLNTLRLPEGATLKPKFDGDWADDPKLTDDRAAYLVLSKDADITFESAPLGDDQATFRIQPIKMEIPGNALAGVHVYGVEKQTTYNQATGQSTDTFRYNSDGMQKPLLYRSGREMQIRNVKDATPASGQGPKLFLNCACWVRIVDDAGKTVDLVPATLEDDKNYNGLESGSQYPYAKTIVGEREPVLPVCSATEVMDFSSLQAFETAAKQATPGPVQQPQGVDLGNLSIYCDDPRYNWAPEDWYRAGANEVNGETWLVAAKSRCTTGNHGGRDIFQFVSDQGYLQSMGELQFLPYLRSFAATENQITGSFFDSGKYNGQWHTAGNLANHAYAWQTHWAFGDSKADSKDGEEADPYKWGIYDTKGGPAVNPYADADLMLAAIANTPYDWRQAFGRETPLTLEEGRKYCFGPSSEEAPVEWKEIQKVAEGIKAAIGESTDWEKEFSRSANWTGAGPFGANFGDDFHDVDRKFLYSYWRSCFANSQQLFLVFVRAEPAVMGGSSAGHTPSQLGARAVALVWREPKSSITNPTGTGSTSGFPHRMRILFYHQFE